MLLSPWLPSLRAAKRRSKSHARAVTGVIRPCRRRSSAISIIAPSEREFVITFVTGRRYVYFDVPEREVEAMRSAFSKGRYFNLHIRDRYGFRELAEGVSE